MNFTEQEMIEMKSNIDQVSTHIPHHLMGWVWSTYRRIVPTAGNQPCSCGSAAGYWRDAVNTIKSFVKENDNR